MSVSGLQLNRLERILFACAVGLAGLLILVRMGALLLLTFLRHAR